MDERENINTENIDAESISAENIDTSGFLNNNLFTQNIVSNFEETLAIFSRDIHAEFEAFRSLYNIELFESLSEGDLENQFIGPALELLGWSPSYQQVKIVQGRQEKPDWILFGDRESYENYQKLDEREKFVSGDGVIAVCESKKYDISLDSGKLDKNPHFQIVNYLARLNIQFGFLTNGRYWRLYDASVRSAQKVFYEVDLEAILLENDTEKAYKQFKLFFHIFSRDYYTKREDGKSDYENTKILDEELRLAIEENLRAVIYGYSGEDSIFEALGEAIYLKNTDVDLKIIYENAVYGIFMLLFIAYFEDRFAKALNNRYQEKSLKRILHNCKNYETDGFYGYMLVKELFTYIDKGNKDIDIPLLNGGLFDPTRAPLLYGAKMIDNERLLKILNGLFYQIKEGKTKFLRDYKTLSIAHIGTIYEGLLSFRFELADEDGYYVEYRNKKSRSDSSPSIDGFYDPYDYAVIKKNSFVIVEKFYKKGSLTLKNRSNARKNTASYYTPQPITEFLVRSAIDNAIENGKKIDEIRILDNACGSGHFLVESLNYLTEIALQELSKNKTLQKKIDDDLLKINEGLSLINAQIEVDVLQVLKRFILKKCIYGVDINPFAVELTKLSLWLDSFIFGAPLSFIEHHIKCGNALIGSTLAETEKLVKKNLFTNLLDTLLIKAKEALNKLESLSDINAEEIESSKQIYREEIAPSLARAKALFNISAHIKLLECRKETRKEAAEITTNIDHWIDTIENAKSIDEIEKFNKTLLSHKYNAFHYECDFTDTDKFDAIVGNPPWDKTKFADSDFFPQFRSNYRIMSDSEKRITQRNLLKKDYIKKQYIEEQEDIAATNDYYKSRFPLNFGSGDGNLFRFFIERNLELLKSGANLCYCVPSAIMFEEGSYTLRKHILENHKLNFFYSFENRKGVFHDVDSRYKFALIGITKEGKTDKIDSFFYRVDLERDLQDHKLRIKYALSDIKKLSPNDLSLMELRSKEDLKIVKKCYSKFKPFSFNWLDFRRELDMTNDKNIFYEKNREGFLPLYEGKMINQFNPYFAEPTRFVDFAEFDEYLSETEVDRLVSDIYPALNSDETPQIKAVLNALDLEYNPNDRQVNINSLKKFIRPDREFFRLGFRAIASDTNERTLIAALLPKNCGCGNSIYVNIPKRYKLVKNEIEIDLPPIDRLLFTMAIFNSITIDYIIRNMVQINVNKTYLRRIPFPQPKESELNSGDYARLIKNSLLLTLAYGGRQFDELAGIYKINKNEIPIQNNTKEIDHIRCENDLIVAKLYGIEKSEMEHILNSFKVLRDNKPEYIDLLLSKMR